MKCEWLEDLSDSDRESAPPTLTFDFFYLLKYDKINYNLIPNKQCDGSLERFSILIEL